MIAFDAVSSLGFVGAASATDTFSHTVGAGANNLLIVAVVQNVADFPSVSVSGVTWNGTPMVHASELDLINDNQGENVLIFYLFGAATGSHSVVVTLTGAASNWQARAISYTGVLGFPDGFTIAKVNPASSISCAVTTINDSDLVVGFVRNYDNIGSAGSGTTARNLGTSISSSFCEANALTSPSGTTTLHWNTGGSGVSNITGFALSPFAIVPPYSRAHGFLPFL